MDGLTHASAPKAAVDVQFTAGDNTNCMIPLITHYPLTSTNR